MNTWSGYAANLCILLGKWAPAMVVATSLCCTQGTAAALTGAEICKKSAIAAAQAHAIPPSALRSLAIEQSGKLQDGEKRPWPWTVETSGIRRWFSDRQSAADFVKRLREQGHHPVKMGCFLIGSPQEPTGSVGAESAMDPAKNAELAARQLAGIFSQTKSWDVPIRRFGTISASPAPESAAPERSERPEPTSSAATPVSAKAQSGAGSLVSLGASGAVHSFWQENE